MIAKVESAVQTPPRVIQLCNTPKGNQATTINSVVHILTTGSRPHQKKKDQDMKGQVYRLIKTFARLDLPIICRLIVPVERI